MAKFSQHQMVFFEDLKDIINDLPADITDKPDDEEDEEQAPDPDKKDDEAEEPEEDKSEEEGEEESDDEEEDEDDNDDYFTSAEDDEEEPAKPTAAATAPVAPAITQSELGKFVLDNLTTIPVRIVVAGKDGEDVIETVSVYGYGDLPSNFKNYASPLEGEQFRGKVTAQEIRAQELTKQFNTNKQQAEATKAQEEYTRKENRAIAEDLTELRKEGLFPKFKGAPGSKEFGDSDGAKEFDKVVAFMNKRNDEYLTRANSGKNYRHIGFREAFEMLHGPNPKAAEQAEDKARKKIAKKVVSKRGAEAQKVKAGVARVSNLNDLADEFAGMGG